MSTSTPPAWTWLDECHVPVGVYQHMTSETPSEAELSIHTHKPPVSDAFRERNDSDQCDECRCAPGQSHATGCESTAQNYNEHINAAPPHPDCWLPTKPDTAPSGDVAGSDDNPFRVSTENEDFYKVDHGDPLVTAALMAEGYREMAGDYCEPEPAHSAIGAGPLFGSGNDHSVPFSTQEWMFESLCEVEIDKLHDLIDTHHDRIIEMARDRFRKGFCKYGSTMYSWSPERRLDETLQELADAVAYPTSGPLE